MYFGLERWNFIYQPTIHGLIIYYGISILASSLAMTFSIQVSKENGIIDLNSIDNISTCAGYCNANSICCSFEYSPTEKMCNLNMECQPIRPMVEDFCFCVKEDFATGGEYITEGNYTTGGHNTSEGGFTKEESTTALVSTTGNDFTTWSSTTAPDSTTLPPSQCIDEGCSSEHNGWGECVDFSKDVDWRRLTTEFDLSVGHVPGKCGNARVAVEECCKCMKSKIHHTTTTRAPTKPWYHYANWGKK